MRKLRIKQRFEGFRLCRCSDKERHRPILEMWVRKDTVKRGKGEEGGQGVFCHDEQRRTG